MNKTAITILFFSLILLLMPNGIFAEQLDVAEYKYYRTIDTSLVQAPVWVELDASILDNTLSDTSDIRVTDDNKQLLPFIMQLESGFALTNIESITASSEQPAFRGETYLAEHMLDSNPNTFFQNDFSTDPSITNIVISLSDYPRLNNVELFFVDESPQKITAYYNNDGSLQQIDQLLSNQGSNNKFTLDLHQIRTSKLYVEVHHDGTTKISELKLYSDTIGKILFEPKSETSYLYYGKANDAAQNLNTDELYTDANTQTVAASFQRQNPLFVTTTQNGVTDNCPQVDNPWQTDTDKDGVGDACDNCPYKQNANQLDSDNDGFGNSCDNCQNVYNPDQLDKNVNSIGWACEDADNDGVANPNDNCLLGANRNQQDVDRDGIGDVCEDDDGDGVQNYADLCKEHVDPSNTDKDNDGVGDACDNCPSVSNRNQQDSNDDGVGNACEDGDADGVIDPVDNCPLVANTNQIDWDKDGHGDACDNCPEHSNRGQQDIDNDGIGDTCDDKESRILENSAFVWIIMIFAIVAILFFAFSLKKK